MRALAICRLGIVRWNEHLCTEYMDKGNSPRLSSLTFGLEQRRFTQSGPQIRVVTAKQPLVVTLSIPWDFTCLKEKSGKIRPWRNAAWDPHSTTSHTPESRQGPLVPDRPVIWLGNFGCPDAVISVGLLVTEIPSREIHISRLIPCEHYDSTWNGLHFFIPDSRPPGIRRDNGRKGFQLLPIPNNETVETLSRSSLTFTPAAPESRSMPSSWPSSSVRYSLLPPIPITLILPRVPPPAAVQPPKETRHPPRPD